MSAAILWAYRFQENGGVSAVMPAQVESTREPLWVHLDSNHEEARSWLEEYLSLDDHFLDALLDEQTRPRVIKDQSAALILLRGVNLNAGSDPEDMVTLRVYADERRIVTLRGRKLMATSDVEEKLKSAQQKITTGSVLVELLDSLLERMSPVLDSLEGNLDVVEESVIEHADASLRNDINRIRIQAILFRRYIAPQRDAIYQLKYHDFPWISSDQQAHLVESHNHVQRYVEGLDTLRERAQIVKDELTCILSDRMNKNTFVLTVVAAIFLPISFLTGLLGVNVGGVPGIGNSSAFLIVSGVLCLVVVFQVVLFKRMKWF